MAGVCEKLLLGTLLVVTLAWINWPNTGISPLTQRGRSYDARSSFTRSLCGTLLIPRDQSSWLSLGSIRTSVVPMAFVANSTTDLTAWGALFLNDRPWTRLWRWMVYSLVTTSWRAERVLPPYIDHRQLHSTDTRRPWARPFWFYSEVPKEVRSAYGM